MESEESQVSVWVGREEKLVLGLSKRTTCADVVAVLLEEQSAQHRLSAARSYCIVEKWRGFERILPHKTRILRLWLAWGEERRDVKFVLVKSDASLASHGARSAEARVVRSGQSPREAKGSARAPAVDISAEKQRRVVRKAFRKLEKMNKRRARAAHRDASCAERMETLVHLVVSQDHTIRQQVQRIRELDAEIERREAQVHVDRMKRHGVNYVQDTYLTGAASASGRQEDGACSTETLAKFEESVSRCEEVVRLQEELWEQEALADLLSGQIQDELNRRWMRRREERRRSRATLQQLQEQEQEEVEVGVRSSQAHAAPEHELFLGEEEEERIRTQLDASLYIGLRLDTDLEAVAGDLELIQEMCAAREKEMRDLLEEVETLETDEGVMKSAWVEQARGLSKAHSVNDDDSDTGLSSLHSQDSDSQPVWESAV